MKNNEATKTTKECEVCGETEKVSASKADGGMLMCQQCKKDFGSRVTNSRSGAKAR